MKPGSMLVLVLDDYHLGDPMFAGQLARATAERTVPVVVVHDSGEEGGRALEARGAIVEKEERGVWPARTDEERRVVERAARDLNRRLVAEMNEQGVPAVRVNGFDRGLFSLGRDGALRCGGRTWLRSLVEGGTVPIVAALVENADGTVIEVPAGLVGAVIGRSGDQIGILRGKKEQTVAHIVIGAQQVENQVITGTLGELLTGAG